MPALTVLNVSGAQHREALHDARSTLHDREARIKELERELDRASSSADALAASKQQSDDEVTAAHARIDEMHAAAKQLRERHDEQLQQLTTRLNSQRDEDVEAMRVSPGAVYVL